MLSNAEEETDELYLFNITTSGFCYLNSISGFVYD
jgi:hypothetical protein